MRQNNDKLLAVIEKCKNKIPIGSLDALKLLEDCHVKACDVKHMRGIPLINAWSTVINGEITIFCHSIATTDNKFHIRDIKGNVTTSDRRDSMIDALLSKFIKQFQQKDNEFSNCQNIDSFISYIPTKIDFESAYRLLTQPGETVSIDAILDQMENRAREEGHLLNNNWREITEQNIAIWAI